MLKRDLADKITKVAAQQLTEGLKAKQNRMKQVKEYFDLYNNQTIELIDDFSNFPFPYFSNFVDKFYSKIDNVPQLKFKIPNKVTLSKMVQEAWEQEKTSTKAGWARKDRVEKKMALISGRAVGKVFASSVNNEYKSHYEVVDIFSFVADPTRGQLMDGNYHGETDIFKTHGQLKKNAELGFYDKEQVQKLLITEDDPNKSKSEGVISKFDLLQNSGVDISQQSYAGQKGVMMCEWVMKYEGEWYYLLFDPGRCIWVRAELLSDVFANNTTPFVSWATHYDEYSFWSKSLADDIAPITEAMRLLLNNAIENEKRRTRPMRLVNAGSLMDIGELQDYIPDNVIVRNPGQDPGIVTIETPEIGATINLVSFLDTSSQAKTGVQDASIEEKDAKVGIYFGQLQQEADRIGTINKEYSESYAHKGYNFFWGLKQHLTGDKPVEMLGKYGRRLEQLKPIDFKDVDDVDDVIVYGGSSETEADVVLAERRSKALAELTGAYSERLNADWVIKTTLKNLDFEQDEIDEALDSQGSVDRQLMTEADEAIQEIILGNTPPLNQGATVSFMQRIKDYVIDEINYVKVGRDGGQKVDKKEKELHDKLLAYMNAHQEIVIKNNVRKLREEEFKQATEGVLGGDKATADEQVDVPPVGKQEQQQALARPFEGGVATPTDAQSASQQISQTLRG